MLKYHCMNCSYMYSPYVGDPDNNIEPVTFFEDLDEFWYCPSCHSTKDEFIEIKENIQEVSNLDSIIPQEETHVPFYQVKDDKVIVRVGSEEEMFLSDDNHFIEYVGLFDENEDVIEIIYLPNFEEKEYIEFDLPDDDFEVRSSCNLHGVWKGIKIENLGLE